MPLLQSKTWRRVRGFAWYLLLTVLALIVGGMLVVLFPTRVTLWLANRSLPGWTINADSIHVGPEGVSARGVTVRLREDSREVVWAKRTRVAIRWPDLLRGRIAAVEVTGLKIDADDRAVEQALAALRNSSPAKSNVEIGRITIRDARFAIAPLGLPVVSGNFEAEILGADQPLRDFLRLRDARVQTRQGRTILSAPKTTVEFKVAELTSGQIRSLAVDGARLDLTIEDAALFPASSTPGKASEWRVDSLVLDDMRVRIDLPPLPVIESGIAMHATGLRSDPDGAELPGEIRISQLTVTPRDAKAKPAFVEAATVRFTSSEIRGGKIHEVRVEGTSVHFNDAWQNVFAAASVVTGESASPTTGAFPFQVKKLTVAGAKAAVGLTGVPTVEGIIGAEFTNLGGPNGGIQTIELFDLHFGLPDSPDGTFHEWLTLPKVKVSFRMDDLVERRLIAKLEIDGAIFRFDRECRVMFARPAGPPSTSPPAPPYIAEEVVLRNARVTLDDLGIGIPPLDFAVNLNLANAPLNDPLSGDTRDVQTVELSNINFVSRSIPLSRCSRCRAFSCDGLPLDSARGRSNMWRSSARRSTSGLIFFGTWIWWKSGRKRPRNPPPHPFPRPHGGSADLTRSRGNWFLRSMGKAASRCRCLSNRTRRTWISSD